MILLVSITQESTKKGRGRYSPKHITFECDNKRRYGRLQATTYLRMSKKLFTKLNPRLRLFYFSCSRIAGLWWEHRSKVKHFACHFKSISRAADNVRRYTEKKYFWRYSALAEVVVYDSLRSNTCASQQFVKLLLTGEIEDRLQSQKSKA